MSAQDVLAVMLETAEAAAVGEFEGVAADLLDARATVAELIEQAQVARVKLQLAGYETRELDAALARAGGEK